MQLRERFAGRPIALTLEQSRGALLFILSKYANLVLYPLHPVPSATFGKPCIHREAKVIRSMRTFRLSCW